MYMSCCKVSASCGTVWLMGRGGTVILVQAEDTVAQLMESL
jgi:hypothetical protein